MALIPKTRIIRLLLASLALSLAFAVYEIYRLAQISQWNGVLLKDESVQLTASSPPELRFKAAQQLDIKGDSDGALALYKSLERQAPAALRAGAKFNSGNIYLRKAQSLKGGAQETQSVPLVELAKQSYRDILRADPQQWDARYNLERALRMQPDGEEEGAGEFVAPLSSERAVTTMRGVTLGLP